MDMVSFILTYKERFDGFTWQVVGGIAVKLGSDSNLIISD